VLPHAFKKAGRIAIIDCRRCDLDTLPGIFCSALNLEHQ
jgi:hypothetical protein